MEMEVFLEPLLKAHQMILTTSMTLRMTVFVGPEVYSHSSLPQASRVTPADKTLFWDSQALMTIHTSPP